MHLWSADLYLWYDWLDIEWFGEFRRSHQWYLQTLGFKVGKITAVELDSRLLLTGGNSINGEGEIPVAK